MYAIRSYYAPMFSHTIGIRTFFNALWTGNPICIVNTECVITSYSIHYTKLYDTSDIEKYTGFNTVHEPRLISSKKLDKLIWSMYEEIYSVKNILKRNLLSPSVMANPVSTIFALYVNFQYRKSIKKRIGPLIT